MAFNLISGDCLSVLAELPESSIDAVVTDPPYELGFMGKSWDASGVAFSPDTWRLVWRVMKPGAHLVAFGAPKNYHRLACAIEDAGFEIRDSLMWVFGSGFPKSLDVSKAIDKAAGAEREIVGIAGKSGAARSCMAGDFTGGEYMETAPATAAAREWSGFGTALKPAYEPIVLARKPLSEGTVAANVLRWGTGALNIDATRVGGGETRKTQTGRMGRKANPVYGSFANAETEAVETTIGRWPANLCHDGSQDVLDLFPSQKSPSTYKRNVPMGIGGGHIYGKAALRDVQNGYGDEGSAARFFYCAKASKHDRAGSKHPTVKPVALMRWLARLVAPPGGTILDPFAGSGTTGQAAIEEGFNVTLIEREAEYIADIERRLSPLVTAAE